MDTLLAFLNKLAVLLPLLVMFAPLVAFGVDTAKRLGVKDGAAPTIQGVVNVVGIVVLFIATDAQRTQIPDALTALLLIAPWVVTLFLGVIATPLAHMLLAKVGIGYSYTVKEQG